MKKMTLIFATLIFMLAFINTAKAQPPHAKAYGKHKFYYYPNSNVYYDAGPNLYYYNTGGAWSGVRTLPPGISMVSGDPRVPVYYNGNSVWNDNATHRVKYKVYNKKTVPFKQNNKNHDKHK